jgi:hypothetical protein
VAGAREQFLEKSVARRDRYVGSEAIVRDGHEVIPRFRIFTADGDFVVLMPLSDNAADRQRRIRLVGHFMAWKMATNFVISAESHAPDSISSFFVGRHEREGLFRPIERGPPISFGKIRALGEGEVEAVLIALLPRRETAMTFDGIAQLERVFGDGEEMPAMPLS